MVCHIQPLKKGKEIPLPSLGPIPSLNSTFVNGMGPRLGKGISPCFFVFLRGGVWQAIAKSFLFFGENFLLFLYSKSDGVLCLHYSRTRIANDTFHVCTYDEPMPPALCLGTPVPMYGFTMACIELQDTGQKSLSHWKARIWLPVAFKKF